MRFIYFLLFVGTLLGEPFEMVVTVENHQAMQLKIVVDKECGGTLFVDNLSLLLGATKQFCITQCMQPEPRSKKEMMALADEGFPLVLFVSTDEKECFWRLYDTMTATLVKGKKSLKKDLTIVEWVIVVADQIWPELTGQIGSFSSLIAVCKRGIMGQKRMHSDLYLIHPFYSFEQFEPIKLVGAGNNFGPRWHRRRAVIFYSQHTMKNVRLMSVDPQRVSRVITSFDGQNMTPAISFQGRVVLALSSSNYTQLYEYCFKAGEKKGSFVRLTSKPGDFISPSFLDENRIVFCYVNNGQVPQLGILNLNDKSIKWLDVGRALCPAVSPSGADLAYCKKVKGTYQLFVYNFDASEERQLTHGKGHKDECSWSPCGNYIVCSLELADDGRIVLVDVNTQAIRYITAANESWAYPNWSPSLSMPFAYRKKVKVLKNML